MKFYYLEIFWLQGKVYIGAPQAIPILLKVECETAFSKVVCRFRQGIV